MCSQHVRALGARAGDALVQLAGAAPVDGQVGRHALPAEGLVVCAACEARPRVHPLHRANVAVVRGKGGRV